jgi:hypothetical protein
MIKNLKKETQLDLKHQEEAIEIEKKEMEKQRIGVKLMINNEIDKMKNLNIDTRYEFK